MFIGVHFNLGKVRKFYENIKHIILLKRKYMCVTWNVIINIGYIIKAPNSKNIPQWMWWK